MISYGTGSASDLRTIRVFRPDVSVILRKRSMPFELTVVILTDIDDKLTVVILTDIDDRETIF
jgi:hypothetical protein